MSYLVTLFFFLRFAKCPVSFLTSQDCSEPGFVLSLGECSHVGKECLNAIPLDDLKKISLDCLETINYTGLNGIEFPKIKVLINSLEKMKVFVLTDADIRCKRITCLQEMAPEALSGIDLHCLRAIEPPAFVNLSGSHLKKIDNQSALRVFTYVKAAAVPQESWNSFTDVQFDLLSVCNEFSGLSEEDLPMRKARSHFGKHHLCRAIDPELLTNPKKFESVCRKVLDGIEVFIFPKWAIALIISILIGIATYIGLWLYKKRMARIMKEVCLEESKRAAIASKTFREEMGLKMKKMRGAKDKAVPSDLDFSEEQLNEVSQSVPSEDVIQEEKPMQKVEPVIIGEDIV